MLRLGRRPRLRPSESPFFSSSELASPVVGLRPPRLFLAVDQVVVECGWSRIVAMALARMGFDLHRRLVLGSAVGPESSQVALARVGFDLHRRPVLGSTVGPESWRWRSPGWI
jgi:hypothetical protein